MTRGRKKDLTEIEQMLLYSGRLASLRGRQDRFWASQAQKVYEQLAKRGISWGALLPALRRLEDGGYLSADWVADDPRRRPIRYYSLTERGKAEAASVQAPSLSATELGHERRRVPQW